MLNSLKLCLSVMLVPFLLALVCLLVLTGACTTLLLRWGNALLSCGEDSRTRETSDTTTT